jgi:hypothetical protein|tara:strand:- start:1996 stop:2697 length:702 start_codon:yes stop_codon:yes gene_type:complete
MSTVFPKYKAMSGSPMDLEEVNDNFQTVITEIQGGLNEHNWRSGAFPNHTGIEAGAMLRIHHSSVRVVHSLVSGMATATIGASGSFRVSNNREWVTIKDVSSPVVYDPMEMTITTGNSLLWIIYNGQQQPFDVSSAGKNLPGCQYGIAVDGAVISETIIGCTDRNNDKTGEGVQMTSHPFSTDCIVPISAGVHTVAIQARCCADEDFTVFSSSSTDGQAYEIFSREMIVIEIR